MKDSNEINELDSTLESRVKRISLFRPELSSTIDSYERNCDDEITEMCNNEMKKQQMWWSWVLNSQQIEERSEWTERLARKIASDAFYFPAKSEGNSWPRELFTQCFLFQLSTSSSVACYRPSPRLEWKENYRIGMREEKDKTTLDVN